MVRALRVGITLLTVFAAFHVYGAAAVVASQSAMKSFVGNQGGIVAFTDDQDNGKVKVVDFNDAALSIRTISSLTACTDPIISADGTRILWVQGGKVWTQRLSGGSAVQLGTGAGAFWHKEGSTDYVVYCDATAKTESHLGDTYRQKIKNGIEADGAREAIYTARAMDAGITSDGRWLGETYGGHNAYDLVNRKEYGTFYKADNSTEGQACNGSMLRDGTHRFLMLVLPHDYIRLFGFNSSEDKWKEVRTYTKPSGTVEWQRPEISVNSSYFTATAKQSDNNYHLYFVKTADGAVLKVLSGNIGNSHLYVGASAQTGPVISLSSSSLSFNAQSGQASPAAQVVTVTNAGSGTLTAVAATESAAWLTVTVGGSGNTQTLSSAVNTSGLAIGTYNTTVTVSGGGASNTPTYTVTLIVSGSPVATTIAIDPASASVAPSGSTQLTATVRDQNGQLFAAVITWQASGLGTVSPATSSSAVSSHTTTFTAGTTIGSALVIATAGELRDTATVSVADIHLKINTGSNTYDVAGWERDDAYTSEGEDWTNPNTITVSGVTGAAPADVYKSVRHRSPHSYSFPVSKVPDGAYLLRIHFADAYSDRSMKYTVEGTVVLENFDVVSEAGVNTALVKEFVVVVSDGNGMQIVCESPTGDVFEAGFEIIRTGGVPSQPAQILSPNGAESYAVGDTMTIRWQGNNDALFNDCVVAISPDGGESWFIINGTESIERSSAQWGSLKWRIPATVNVDGQVLSMVSSACIVKVYQYNDANVYDISDAAFTVTAGSSTSTVPVRAKAACSWRVDNTVLFVRAPDGARIQLFTVAGALVLDRTVLGDDTIELRRFIGPGMHVLRLWYEQSSITERISVIR